MWPVFSGLIAIVVVSLYSFITLILDYTVEEFAYDSAGMKARWQIDHSHHIDKLSVVGLALAQNSQVREAMKAGDRARLIEAGTPLYESLGELHHVDRMAIIDRERRILVRYHDPDKFGDRVGYLTLLGAESGRIKAHGVGFDYKGYLIERVFVPVLEQDTILGYVAAGESIDDLLRHLDETFGVQHITLVGKDYIEKYKPKKIAGVESQAVDSERFASFVMLGKTIDYISPLLHDWINSNGFIEDQHKIIQTESEQYYLTMSLPLVSINSERIGTVVALRDVSTQYLALKSSIVMASSLTLLIVIGLLLILRKITQRTENQFTSAYKKLEHAQLQLEKGRQYWDDAFNAIADPVFIHDGKPLVS